MPVETYGAAPGVDYLVPNSLSKAVPPGYMVKLDKSGHVKEGTDLRVVKKDNPEVELKSDPPTKEAVEWLGHNKEYRTNRDKLAKEEKQDKASSDRARKRQDERNK